MSYFTDFESAPFPLFVSTGIGSGTDTSVVTLLGTRFATDDGRIFTLVQNGATALAAGVLVQGPATIGANHAGLTIGAAVATGGTSITATLGGTATTVNQYQGGYLVVSAGTGFGQTLKIASNTATGTSGVVTVVVEDPLSNNIAVSDSKVTLTLSPYGGSNGTAITTHGVIIAPSGTSTGLLLGVTPGPIAASTSTVANYGWVQNKGPIACLAAGTATAGLGAMLGAVNGAVSVQVAATDAQIGRFITTAEDAKKQLIFIDC